MTFPSVSGRASVTSTEPKIHPRLRDEALLLMDGRGSLLDTARDLSRLLRDAGLSGAVIGGIAVVLHGHLRTTRDIDIYSNEPLDILADLLTSQGFTLDAARREFVREGIPVHLVRPDQVPTPPRELLEIDGITTVSLADLIAMKLRSGTRNLLRAQDLADVIGLIRRHDLDAVFARDLPKDLRPEFRKLVRAIRQEG